MIYINDIPSLRDPDSENYTFDDRIQKVSLIKGNIVQDYGHIESGDTFSLSCVFSFENYQKVKALWTSRALVTYTDSAGQIFTNCRLIFKSVQRVASFLDYVTLTFEIWRC